jgi:acyl-CoA hydrolase
LVVVQQGVSEPTPLLRELLAVGSTIADLEVFVGLSHSDALVEVRRNGPRVVSFGALARLDGWAREGLLAILPGNFSDVPRLVRHRASGRLVLAVQLSPADGEGMHSWGTALDYTYEVMPFAGIVLAEINEAMPVTSSPTVPTAAIAGAVHAARPLPTMSTARIRDIDRRIAENVAVLVPNGSTIQLGVGGLAAAVGNALTVKRELRVRSTLAGDWLLELDRASALSRAGDAILVSEIAGSDELYRLARDERRIAIRPVSEVTDAAALARTAGFIAMNSALEVDLTGQVNAELIDSGYVGAIGGQPDYMRAAQRSPDGAAILMLPATNSDGSVSRIVTQLNGGVVTTARSTVDLVVTGYGCADLRGRSLAERREALLNLAAPQHRATLQRTL